MCDPKPRTGSLLRGDLIQIVDKLPDGLKFSRGWDVASSEKQRAKDDPDYTCGVKSAFKDGNLYIDDVVRGQWEALKREQVMLETARVDGPGCTVYVEVVAGYKDTYTRLKSLLSGKSVVRPIYPKGDKVQRNSIFEPLMEGGKVFMRRAPWNERFRAAINAFPKDKHDDEPDGLFISAYKALTAERRMSIGY
jgi:predicted phage terminase large subunit-like protein